MTFKKESGAYTGSSCGRVQALVVLLRMLTRRENKRLLARTLAAEFRANPAKFRKLVRRPPFPKVAPSAVPVQENKPCAPG